MEMVFLYDDMLEDQTGVKVSYLYVKEGSESPLISNLADSRPPR
jgi:hypothetical protein